MDDAPPRLYIVTVMEDEDGMVQLNYDGLEPQHALWLLASASRMLLEDYWSTDEDD
jgi:hypothetical protein